MKLGNLIKAIAPLLLVSMFLSLFLSPTANATNFTYSDSVLGYFSVACSPDLAKPGDVLTANVTGRLAAVTTVTSVVFHITYSIQTSSSPAKILNEQDMVIDNKTTSKSSITQIVIPADALNNVYVYATVTNGTVTFSKIPLALNQNPTYSDLQAQVANLSSSLNSQQINSTALQYQLSALQTNYANLNASYITLQANLNMLTNQTNTLQTNNTSLKTQLTVLLAENATLHAQLINFQKNCSALQIQLDNATESSLSFASDVDTLQSDNGNLTSQVTDLQNQLTTLQTNSTTLQNMFNNLNNQTLSMQASLSVLQLQNDNLASKNSSTSLIMYTLTGVAVGAVATTVFLVVSKMRTKKKSRLSEAKNGKKA
jgi:predicted nuclease with TOPRIM domain